MARTTQLAQLSTEACWRVCMRRARYWLEASNPRTASRCVRDAMHFANKLDKAHRRSTLRILNWIRADIARTV
jgi:hypothetical protein